METEEASANEEARKSARGEEESLPIDYSRKWWESERKKLAEERRESGEEGAVKDYSHIPHGRERESEKLKQEIMERKRDCEERVKFVWKNPIFAFFNPF